MSSRNGTLRNRLIALLLVLGLVTTAACGTFHASASDVTPGVLRIAMSAGNIPFPSTPPNEGYEGYRFVGNNIYDALVRFDLTQDKTIPSLEPGLAESWTISPDQLTWTFSLRKGVEFHDGTPFDADSVIFQLDRLKNPEFKYYAEVDSGRYAAYTKYIASYRKIDDYTVALTSAAPYAWMLYSLAHLYFPSPTAIEKYGNDDYNQHASGTGPFVMTKYVDGEVMELTANEHYWNGRPKLDKIILYPQPEPASRLASLQSGEVDWAEVPSPDAVDQLKDEGYQVFMGEYPHGIMPRFNFFRPPFKDNLKLRQALNYALDRESTAALINDVGYPARQYVYPGHPDYATDDPGYEYDPAKAKQLLAEAGYDPGELTVNFAYPTGGSGNMFPDVMMQRLQADFEAIGVGVNLLPMEWNTIITVGLEGLQAPQWSNIDILWSSPAAGMQPAGYASTFLCEVAPDVPNATGLCNQDVDQNYLLASQSFDEAQSHAYLQKMMAAAVDDADFLFWMHDLNLRVMSPAVKGYVQAKSWWVDFTTISIGS